MNGVYYSCLETIDKISDMIDSDTPGGYFRFGDGDMNLALGLSEMLQQSNPQLQVYMSNASKEKDKKQGATKRSRCCPCRCGRLRRPQQQGQQRLFC